MIHPTRPPQAQRYCPQCNHQRETLRTFEYPFFVDVCGWCGHVHKISDGKERAAPPAQERSTP